MISVFVNGVHIAASLYTINEERGTLSFDSPPGPGTIIVVKTPLMTANYDGTGTHVVYDISNLTSTFRFNRILGMLQRHATHPAVQEKLEELQVILELLD